MDSLRLTAQPRGTAPVSQPGMDKLKIPLENRRKSQQCTYFLQSNFLAGLFYLSTLPRGRRVPPAYCRGRLKVTTIRLYFMCTVPKGDLFKSGYNKNVVWLHPINDQHYSFITSHTMCC